MEYLAHLSKDRKLKKLLEEHAPLSLSKRKEIHFYLIASIMSQQLSAKVAAIIESRFLALYGDRIPSAAEVLATPLETLRGIGLSNAKAGYVHNVAQFAVGQGMDHRKLGKMSNEEAIEYLIQIKGVGRWTAEMLLMFGLGREDVFAIDDWGVQNAMIHLYKLDRTDKKAFREELLRISAKWVPYRSYACMFLWRWKDNKPVTAVKKRATVVKKRADPVKKK